MQDHGKGTKSTSNTITPDPMWQGVARKVKQQLSHMGWAVLPHPPYSPDLAPSDYWLFGDLQRHLEGRDFNTRGTVEAALKQYFDSRPAGFWKDGIHKLPERWRQVVDNNGAYC